MLLPERRSVLRRRRSRRTPGPDSAPRGPSQCGRRRAPAGPEVPDWPDRGPPVVAPFLRSRGREPWSM
ncbi:hypothetical protein FKP32DRAFT_464884 [Trametes sanguinea]|nr:hypothetical protein FKP32DRAFT_464884 [Trametes sanguinea]